MKDMARDAKKLPGAKLAPLSDEPFAPQLAKLAATPPTGDQWLHEIKWDGYRIIATVVKGRARLFSRNAIEWTKKVPEIARAIESLGLQSAALDGELIAGAGTKQDFTLLQGTLSGERKGSLALVLFDLLHINGVDIASTPLVERKALLEKVLKNPPPQLSFSSHITGDGANAFKLASSKHFEGIVSKRSSAPHRAGRSDDWLKSKNIASDEFAVVGFTAPKGSRSGFGSLLLATPDGPKRWRYVGRVGSGFSDELIREITKTLDRDASVEPTVEVPANDTDLRTARWFKPLLVLEVFYRGIGKNGLLRQPSLKTIRPDKSPADLKSSDKLETPMRKSASKDQVTGRKTKKSAGSRKGGLLPPDFGAVAGVRLTSADRVVFPDNGYTKGDVAAYYAAIMPWLLPEIVGRPLSVIRCTEGAGGACFFQKHHTAGLGLVGSVRLKEASGAEADYLVVKDARAVMELVQFNALEFHPWGSHASKPDAADRLVFDLDPGPGVTWTAMTRAARKIKALLEQQSLTSFVRTSGGKGLHVVVPLNPPCNWEQAKEFASGLAHALAESEPQDFVATSTKNLRKGKIFIDYLRNSRGATSVASFSLRAREGAPVAMPLRWDELGKIKSGAAYNLRSAVARMRRLKAHPWRGIDDVKQRITAVPNER